MANAGVRLTLKFNLNQGFKTCGWSESFDLLFDTIASAVSNQSQIDQFVRARLNCLGEGVICVSAVLTADPGGIRVPPAPRRASVAIKVPDPIDSTQGQTSYNISLANHPADFGTTVLYFSMTTDPNNVPVYRRNCWIAGIPDASSSTDAVQPLAGVWNTFYQAFLAQLFPQKQSTKLKTQSIIAIRSIDSGGLNPIKNCTVYDNLLNRYTVPAHGFVVGQLIQAVGFRPKPGQVAPRGQYKVTQKIDDNTISISATAVTTATVPPGGFRAVKYVWNPTAFAAQDGFSKRNKGRPFELEVGRRRRQVTTRA